MCAFLAVYGLTARHLEALLWTGLGIAVIWAVWPIVKARLSGRE